MAATGATTSGTCILCQAGTYQTGSGQMQWWWTACLSNFVVTCSLDDVDQAFWVSIYGFSRDNFLWNMHSLSGWNLSDWIGSDAVMTMGEGVGGGGRVSFSCEIKPANVRGRSVNLNFIFHWLWFSSGLLRIFSSTLHIFQARCNCLLLVEIKKIHIDQLQGSNLMVIYTAAGATTSNACIPCQAGTYQTGSGWMQWW